MLQGLFGRNTTCQTPGGALDRSLDRSLEGALAGSVHQVALQAQEPELAAGV